MNPSTNLFQKVSNRFAAYRSTPNCVRERGKLGLRRFFGILIQLPMWVTTHAGAKMYLGRDPVDETILYHLTSEVVERYFPEDLTLAQGDLVLDVGGHHGQYAVELLARYPGINIFCIEPDPEGIRRIHTHIAKNRAERNIDVVPYAVGENESIGYLADNDDGSWGKTLETRSNGKTIPVRVKPLDQILPLERRNVKLVKSNCEGGEFTLISQMIQLGLKPELIILMIHPERGSVSDLVKTLEEYGYSGRAVYESDTHPCWHFRLSKSGGAK